MVEAVEHLANHGLVGDDVLPVRHSRIYVPVIEVSDVYVHIARPGIADRRVARLNGVHGLEVPGLDVHRDMEIRWA